MKKSVADKVVESLGSWTFIGGQAVFLSAWLTLNGLGVLKFDKPPYILLNLLLSFQSAFTAPILLMSSNRQAMIDRKRAIDHFKVDLEEVQVMTEMVKDIKKLKQILREKHDGEEHY